MLSILTKIGSQSINTIPRLSCNLLSRVCTEQILPQLNRCRIYLRDSTSMHMSTCILKKNRRILLELSVNKSNLTVSLYSTEFELSTVKYEKICNETLDSLTEYFEELIEAAEHLPSADVTYGDGVLTVMFGKPYGTYVINRQTPNKQIWLSSPKSGPKRYDFINGQWIYKHDGKSLHEILNNEISEIVRNQTCFNKCSFSGKEKESIYDG